MATNALEVALELATKDPGHRPSFYRQLLESEVVVLLGPADDGSSHGGTGMMIWTRIDGVKVIPFFSSLAVYQQQPNAKAQPVIIPARRLLEAAQIHSMHLHLNPHREFGREFALEELASLLADGTIHSGTTQTVVDAPMQVIFRTPQDEIDGFRTGLVSLLMSSQQVRAAYLFEMERLNPSSETSLIVGIAGPHEESLLTSISTVVADTYTGRLPVDVMFLTSDDQVASLQRAAIPPIFKRSWQEPSRSPQAGLQ